MRHIHLVVCLALLLLTHRLIGQDWRLSNSIPVFGSNGTQLPFAWSGGMNTPQFSSTDMNLDGIDDLVIFEREGALFRVFLGKGIPGQTAYYYSPRHVSNFDSCDCIQWALMRDYNCDGIKDIFCGQGSGQNFRVYEGVVYGGDSVGFELRYNPIQTQASSLLNLYQTLTDIPAIEDVDYDGDLDIVASQAGFNSFALHRNYSMEYQGNCDSLIYVRETGCWGHFFENSTTNTLYVADTVFCRRSDGSEPPVSRHEGSSLLVLDTNADSLVDILLGDVSYRTAVMAYNHGTIGHAFMDSVEVLYPQLDSSINVILFPAFYYEDVNYDKVKDLIVAPNIFSGAENINQVVWYENLGQDNMVDFSFRDRTLLAPEQIDAGVFSSPLFFDYNGDGLQDLVVVASNTNYITADTVLGGTIESHLYKNTGTASSPAFTLITRNYLNLFQLAPGIQGLTPALGDIDGDGDQDMMVGNNLGTLYLLQNVAPAGQPASFMPVVTNPVKDQNQILIDAGSQSAPELYDIDQDGDLDLFIGNQAGRIQYYQNTGTAQQAAFTLVTTTWGDIKLSDQYNSLFSGNARPRFIDYDDDGVVELAAGEVTGVVEIYENISQAASGPLVKAGDLFGYDFGAYASAAAAKLDNTGKYTWAIGNSMGGVMLYRWEVADTFLATDADAPLARDTGIRLYPNPSAGMFTLDLEPDWFRKGPVYLTVMDITGRHIWTGQADGVRSSLDLSGQPSGIYLLRIQGGDLLQTLQVQVVR
ncbi:MAG: FG-GAP-like repeat-containing protein [Bacteroidia bacterium]|nr:FG-GAP-like repeat-containing protein [Bacteroidia bacterium]